MKPVENILPRQIDPNVGDLLAKFSRLINDAVNFGTYLMKGDAEKHRTGDENLPPVLFLRNILDLGDAISVLIQKSSTDSGKILLRSLLENFCGLEYMLKADMNRRALCYILWYTHKNLKLYDKLNSSSPAGKQFIKEIKKDDLLGNSHGLVDPRGLIAAIQNLESLLKKPWYVSIEAEYQRVHAQQKNPPWYTLFGGPENIEQLARNLSHRASYDFFYRSFSVSVHATEVLDSKLVSNPDGTVSIVQLRILKEAQSVTVNTINFLNLSFQVYYKYRLPERETDCKNWYITFRAPFHEFLSKKLLMNDV